MVYLHDKVLKDYFECPDYLYVFSDGSLKYNYKNGVIVNYRTFYRHISNTNAVKILSQSRLDEIFCSIELPWFLRSFDFKRYDLFMNGLVKILF